MSQRRTRKAEPPPEIEMRRDWLRGGMFRAVRGARRLSSPVLPLWARLGMMLPVSAPTFLTVVSLTCAVVGAVLAAWLLM